MAATALHRASDFGPYLLYESVLIPHLLHFRLLRVSELENARTMALPFQPIAFKRVRIRVGVFPFPVKHVTMKITRKPGREKGAKE